MFVLGQAHRIVGRTPRAKAFEVMFWGDIEVLVLGAQKLPLHPLRGMARREG